VIEARWKHYNSVRPGVCSHVGVCMKELAPGKQTCPAHYHMLEEEHLLLLEGKASLRLGEKTFELSAGSYVGFPARSKGRTHPR
jgi:uncharacterized cupin superfamily protein